jgi:hypothetical protein
MPKRRVLRSKMGKTLKPVPESASKPRCDTMTCQFNVRKDVEDDKKVREKDVFDKKSKTPYKKKK